MFNFAGAPRAYAACEPAATVRCSARVLSRARHAQAMELGDE